ncbi:hypothetical protein U370_04055 [Anaplasma marginale str. Dawn]|nr:hypothetical protein U370_04055 [Anaplasma marginale str. Dawn]
MCGPAAAYSILAISHSENHKPLIAAVGRQSNKTLCCAQQRELLGDCCGDYLKIAVIA